MLPVTQSLPDKANSGRHTEIHLQVSRPTEYGSLVHR